MPSVASAAARPDRSRVDTGTTGAGGNTGAGGKPRSPSGRAKLVRQHLRADYPVALCELVHANPFQLLAATILSAQCTDERVNQVTPRLFARYPTPAALAAAETEELEEIIKSTGFFRNKAKSLIGMARAVDDRFDGEIPGAMEELVTIPGVGRKTANVVRSVALGLPGLPVDTHVLRLSMRLGLTTETDPVKVEFALNKLVPAAERGEFGLRMILHGRRICDARKPACDQCTMTDFCPSSVLIATRGKKVGTAAAKHSGERARAGTASGTAARKSAGTAAGKASRTAARKASGTAGKESGKAAGVAPKTRRSVF